ncbi:MULTISPECIES: PadR family transcriptional regulator [Hoyosella]|uniref:DNA-binding PadR family transcriptional regulator n=2 Tax=Hoyosella TaxID=697025 RepID=A0A839RVM6_9ACTN|nr:MULTISPECIES: PadR family transcriptional regulator [Hoyosella]AEF40315.1 Putative PadR family transcriptional regulator [Hoyosella subflava DQS3-9A1]MBB3039913.1 DNA-binding PadR family transcriptional regulator [Hoyosella altamirensis]
MRHEHRNRNSRVEERRAERRARQERPRGGLHIEGFGAGPGLIRIGGPVARRTRGRRRDVRSAVLLLLAESPMHGYQLIQEIEERSGGEWKPSPGSIYPTLSALEDEGLLVIERIEGRKTARLTAEGTEYVGAQRETLGDPFLSDGAGATQARDLRELARLLAAAARQVAAVGTVEQYDQASTILTDARKALYRLLAEDSGQGE